MVRFPRVLRVLGYEVPVKWQAPAADGEGDWAWGETVGWDTGKLEIHLNPKLREEPEWFQRQVLAHETMHALLSITGLGEAVGEKAEEQICKHAELLAEVFWAKRGNGKGAKAAPGQARRISRKPRRRRDAHRRSR